MFRHIVLIVVVDRRRARRRRGAGSRRARAVDDAGARRPPPGSDPCPRKPLPARPPRGRRGAAHAQALHVVRRHRARDPRHGELRRRPPGRSRGAHAAGSALRRHPGQAPARSARWSGCSTWRRRCRPRDSLLVALPARRRVRPRRSLAAPAARHQPDHRQRRRAARPAAGLERRSLSARAMRSSASTRSPIRNGPSDDSRCSTCWCRSATSRRP